MNVYDFELEAMDGSKVSLADYFTKFLIDREGNIVKRFEPTAPMDKVPLR